MVETARLIIAEDHTLVRQGIKAILAMYSEIEIVGEAEDGRTAIKYAAELEPDLVLLDLSMPNMNGTEAISEIKRVSPETRILIITVHKEDEHVIRAFQEGANGYLLKYACHEELIIAIRSILQGHNYISPRISGIVIEGYLKGECQTGFKTAWDNLTAREREIIKLIAEGHRNKDIAKFLCISLGTVRTHRANLMKKLEIHNVSELTALAIEKGLVVQ